MHKKKVNANSNQSFKIIIILLTMVVLASFFYIYKISARTKNVVISLREEKSLLLKDLERSGIMLEQAIQNKTSLNKELLLEQQKIKKLIQEIKKKDLSQAKIIKIKQGANNVNDKIITLMNEIKYYKEKSDSIHVVVKQQKVINDTLINSNNQLSKKVTEAAKFYYHDLQAIAYKVKSSGKKLETDRASRTNILKIIFSIAENKIIAPTDKTFYIQILDRENNIIGIKKTERIGDNELNYNIKTSVKFKNETIKIVEEIPVENLKKGTFYINIFDKSSLVLSNSIILL